MAWWDDLTDSVKSALGAYGEAEETSGEAAQAAFGNDNTDNNTDSSTSAPPAPGQLDKNDLLAFADKYDRTQNPSLWEKTKTFVGNAAREIPQIASNFTSGAKSGYEEIGRAQRQFDSIAMYDSATGSYVPKPGYTQNDVDYAHDQLDTANKTFRNESLYMGLGAFGIVGAPFTGGSSLAISGVAGTAGMAEQAAGATQQALESGESPTKAAGAGIEASTYGPLKSELTNPNLGQQFYNNPVSATGNVLMAGLQAFAPFEFARRGVVSGKVKDISGNDIPTLPKEQANDLVNFADKYDNNTESTVKTSTSVSSGNEFEALVDAISGQESGGNYGAVNERTGAAGRFQIMPDNWPEWADQAGIGRDAPMTPENQDIVARYKLRDYYDKYGARGAAEAWYGGEGAVDWSETAKNRRQGNGDEPSVNEYADSVMGRMGNVDESGSVARPEPRYTEEPIQEESVPAIERQNYSEETISEGAKEPWQMTRETAKVAESDHKDIVEQALEENSPVPREVVNEYPDLAEKYKDQLQAVNQPKEQPTLISVEQKLANEINQKIEPVSPAVGGSIKATNKTLQEKPETNFEFKNSDTEKRWQEASKGIMREGFFTKLKDGVKSLWYKATRVYENLPNTAEFSPLKYNLITLEKQKGVAADRTARLLQGITIDLEKPEFDLFTRKVILDDLAESEGELPFGFTKESLAEEKTAVDNAIKSDPAIAKAVEIRNEVWSAIKNDYTKAMKDINFDVSDRLSRENYFRHQILDYANIRAITDSGSKLKTPTNRGFLKKREGSELDFNANYLQAEFEVMAQMVYDTELAKTIKFIDKNYSIRTKLFDEFGNEWRNNIPDGYTTWQPREGTSFYMANSIPESVATEVLSGAMEEVGVSADQIRQVLAKGSPFKELVVKQEVADTLNKISTPTAESAIGKLSRSLVTPWKQWVLMSPTRAIKYNLRNVTGDADALFAMNRSAFKEVPRAIKELYQTVYGDRAMTPEMGEWFRRGGMETTSPVQDLPDINNLRMFEKYAEKDPNYIRRAWNAYWNKARTATQFREAIFRYATYLDYLKQMDKSGGKPNNFGASVPEEVMALSDIRDRAFKLSNDVLGAYDNVSVLGKDIRTHVIPFWSWYETNFKRYTQFLRNQDADGTLGSAISRKLIGNVLIRSPYYAYAIGSFTLKAGMMWAALQAYNNIVYPEEEKALPVDEQARPHLILGRDANGKVRYFSRLGSFSDFLEWFGLDTPAKDAKDFLDGSRSLKEIVKDMGKNPINKIVQGVSPTIKTLAELLTGKRLFPDAFEARMIRDNAQYIADSLGLGNEFKAISKTSAARELGINPRPSKPYFSEDTGESFLYYKAEPGQSAYYSIQDKKRDFLKSVGEGGDGEFDSPRTEALRNYKIAIRLKDADSAAFYLDQYKQLGGKRENIKKSLESMDPLSGLSQKNKSKFKRSLNGEDQEELKKATDYYKTTMLGK